VISTGQGPGDTGPGGKCEVYAFDVQGTKATNMRLFTDMMLDGIKCGPDGMRADVFGNLWISSNAPLGYAGVLCFTKEAKPRRGEIVVMDAQQQTIALAGTGAAEVR
jgi:gluconolactonase